MSSVSILSFLSYSYLYPLFRIPFLNNKSLTPSSITITPTFSTNSIFYVYFVRYTFSSLSRISWLLTTLKRKDSQWRTYPELSSGKCSALEMRSLPGTRNQMLLQNIWFMCIISLVIFMFMLCYVILCLLAFFCMLILLLHDFILYYCFTISTTTKFLTHLYVLFLSFYFLPWFFYSYSGSHSSLWLRCWERRHRLPLNKCTVAMHTHTGTHTHTGKQWGNEAVGERMSEWVSRQAVQWENGRMKEWVHAVRQSGKGRARE